MAVRVSTQERESLLVENAILKHNEHVRVMLKEELAPFSKIIKEMDNRLDMVEREVSSLKEVVAPFASIRKRLWFLVIAVSLTVTVLGDKLINLLGNTLNK